MVLNYYLDAVGYAGVIFEYENFRRNYTVEYCIGDNLTELLEGLIMLMMEDESAHKILSDIYIKCIEARNNDEGFFEWIADVGASKAIFSFKKINSTDEINLSIYEDSEEQKGVIFEANIKLFELVDNILESCETILSKYGIIGYYMNFWMEFPVSQYLLLNQLRKKNIKIDAIQEIINDENTTMIRSNIQDEVFLLSKENGRRQQTDPKGFYS